MSLFALLTNLGIASFALLIFLCCLMIYQLNKAQRTLGEVGRGLDDVGHALDDMMKQTDELSAIIRTLVEARQAVERMREGDLTIDPNSLLAQIEQQQFSLADLGTDEAEMAGFAQRYAAAIRETPSS